MEFVSDLHRILWQLVHRKISRHCFDQFWKKLKFTNEFTLFGMDQKREISFIGNALFFRLAQNTTQAGMRVLYIVNRIFLRAFFGQTEVKIHVRFRRIHEKEKSRHIMSDCFNKLINRHHIPCALAHTYFDSILHHFHQLHDKEANFTLES